MTTHEAISDSDLDELFAAYAANYPIPNEDTEAALLHQVFAKLPGLVARLRAAEAAVQRGHDVANEFIGRQM